MQRNAGDSGDRADNSAKAQEPGRFWELQDIRVWMARERRENRPEWRAAVPGEARRLRVLRIVHGTQERLARAPPTEPGALARAESA